MQIAIVGPGGIGSTFAFQLSEAGHDVTVIARGTRLEQLRHAGAIVTVEGERAAVHISGEFDTTTDWDLVLVTVLASQVDMLLPALSAVIPVISISLTRGASPAWCPVSCLASRSSRSSAA
jgi:2-dehydropantoate 2-reductase